MPKFKLRDFKEPRSAAGEVLLSHNHIALLNGLYDRPSGRASSTADFIDAALAYREIFGVSGSGLQRGAQTMHPGWVKDQYVGSRRNWTLTKRGKAIVERTVPARIRGDGPYLGVAEHRRKRSGRRQSSG